MCSDSDLLEDTTRHTSSVSWTDCSHNSDQLRQITMY